jgi:hypothetical protein
MTPDLSTEFGPETYSNVKVVLLRSVDADLHHHLKPPKGFQNNASIAAELPTIRLNVCCETGAGLLAQIDQCFVKEGRKLCGRRAITTFI